ncbi:hypothetical protein ABW20_dc0104480 [Dactylellina cionopaga]|nr:hypothetical protein ABW20_dc0104480 [Dactylellina cionopaga]
MSLNEGCRPSLSDWLKISLEFGGQDLTRVDHDTALHIAVNNHDPFLVNDVLLAMESCNSLKNLEERSPYGRTALQETIIIGKLEMARAIVSVYERMRIHDLDGLVCRRGEKLLRKIGLSATQPLPSFMMAILYGDKSIVDLFDIHEYHDWLQPANLSASSIATFHLSDINDGATISLPFGPIYLAGMIEKYDILKELLISLPRAQTSTTVDSHKEQKYMMETVLALARRKDDHHLLAFLADLGLSDRQVEDSVAYVCTFGSFKLVDGYALTLDKMFRGMSSDLQQLRLSLQSRLMERIEEENHMRMLGLEGRNKFLLIRANIYYEWTLFTYCSIRLCVETESVPQEQYFSFGKQWSEKSEPPMVLSEPPTYQQHTFSLKGMIYKRPGSVVTTTSDSSSSEKSMFSVGGLPFVRPIKRFTDDGISKALDLEGPMEIDQEYYSEGYEWLPFPTNETLVV